MEAVGLGFFRVLLLMALVVSCLYVLVKLLGALAWMIGACFRGIGRFFRHIGRFVVNVVRDALQLAGALITVAFYLPSLVLHVASGRWSAANHYGRAVEQEILTIGGCVYRLAIGHAVRLLGLSSLTDGVEQRLPEVIARVPRSGPRLREGFDGPPDRFDGYRVVGSLQAGGSGARLWLAEPDAPTRRRLEDGGRRVPGRVVIKSFSLAEGSTLPQIVRENRALEAARDLGLVLEHRLEGQRFHYVMPYVPGDDLGLVAARLHARDGTEGLSDGSLRQVLDHTAELLETLDRFHGQGLWHKDVKPTNVIVSEGRVHLVDLGLMTPLTSAMTLTTHGTEYFRDPEMVRLALRGVKVHEVDGVKFDVYGAGATLFALIENSFPAHGSLSQTTRRCPEALRWVIRKAMADLSGRYTSARQMLADVRAVRDAADPFKLKPAQLPSFRGQAPDAPAARPGAWNAPALAAARDRATPVGAAPRQRAPWRTLLLAVGVGMATLFALRGIEQDRSPGPAARDSGRGAAAAPAEGAARPLQVLPAVSLERRPSPEPVAEALLPPVGSVLLIDDLPAGVDARLRARVESLCRDLRAARYAVVRDAGDGEASDEDIALLAGARVATGLGDPSDEDAVSRLSDFLAVQDPRLVAVLWIGGGRDGAPVDCRAIARDDEVGRRLSDLVSGTTP